MGCCASRDKIIKYKPGIKFSNIANQLKPLDLIVFRGAECVSDIISKVEKKFLGNGEWTHVGIVVTTDIIDIKNGTSGKLYIWESTMSGQLGDGVNDVELQKGKFGVQIRDLAEVIDHYDKNADSKIGWCPLIESPFNKKENETEEAYVKRIEGIKFVLNKFHEEKGHLTYDYNLCNLCSTVCCTCTQARRCICGHSDKMFCSELVANIYELVGIIPKIVDPERIAPIELLGFTNDNFKSPVHMPPIIIVREWPTPLPTVDPNINFIDPNDIKLNIINDPTNIS